MQKVVNERKKQEKISKISYLSNMPNLYVI